MRKHFKFHITDPKQLMIAFTGAFSTWAATGFQHDLPHLSYVVIGFISGGLVSHESSHIEQTIPENAHIVTPYSQNLTETPIPENQPAQPQGANISKLVQINSGIIK
jgi:hypothetical protein